VEGPETFEVDGIDCPCLSDFGGGAGSVTAQSCASFAAQAGDTLVWAASGSVIRFSGVSTGPDGIATLPGEDNSGRLCTDTGNRFGLVGTVAGWPENHDPSCSPVQCGAAGATADLSLAKTVDDATPLVGGSVVFSLMVANAGSSSATGVEVTDLLPAGYSFVSDDSGGAYASGTGVWTVGSVGAGGSATLEITATANAAGSYTNIAEVTAADQADPDSTPGNAVPSEDDYATRSTSPTSGEPPVPAFSAPAVAILAASLLLLGARLARRSARRRAL
jgi:uncharacterized repeat protein (TIGR01451 family)